MWKTRVAIISLVALILGLLLLLSGLLIVRSLQQRQRLMPYNTATFLKNIQTLNQLVTVQHRMEKVVILEDPPTGTLAQFLTGESRVILVAHGVVKAGVDLTKITESDLVLRGTNLTIKLPRSEITDVYLDESRTQVIEHKTGFLRKFDTKLPQIARQQAVNDMRRAAREYEILGDADKRAQLSLEKLFESLGVSVKFAE